MAWRKPSPPPGPIPAVTQMLERAGELFRINPTLITSRSRTVRVTRARFAVELAMRSCGWSLMEIGDELGGRDHTSVIYGVERAEETCKEEPQYAAWVDELTRILAPPAVEHLHGQNDTDNPITHAATKEGADAAPDDLALVGRPGG